MSNIRRYHLENRIYFITVVTKERKPIFKNEENVHLLFSVLRDVKTIHPFESIAHCVLYDHVHLMIKPADIENHNISRIMHSIKKNFTERYKLKACLQKASVWQRRFYDHVIRDDEGFNKHLNYIHYNPVKHRIVNNPKDYEFSSFRYYEKLGYYEDGWGHVEPDNIKDLWLE